MSIRRNGQEGSACSGRYGRGRAVDEHRGFKAALTRQVRIVQCFSKVILSGLEICISGSSQRSS